MQSKTAPPSDSPHNLDGQIQSDDEKKTLNVRGHSVARKGQNNRILLIAVAFLSLGWLTTLVFWYKTAPKPQDFLVSTLHQQYCQVRVSLEVLTYLVTGIQFRHPFPIEC